MSRTNETAGDATALPFADGAFDLIVSVGALDTVNDLPGALLLARRALRPDGLFMAAFAGAGSLIRLKQAMLAADEAGNGASAHVHPQIDVRAAGDLVDDADVACGMRDPHRSTVDALGQVVERHLTTDRRERLVVDRGPIGDVVEATGRSGKQAHHGSSGFAPLG